jgi:perosamine synthetase
MHCEAPNVIHSYWMISILTRSARDRKELRTALGAAGIETRPVFYPIHTMPMYASRFQRHPVAEDIAWRGITLPSWPGLPEATVDNICAVIARFYIDAASRAEVLPRE